MVPSYAPCARSAGARRRPRPGRSQPPHRRRRPRWPAGQWPARGPSRACRGPVASGRTGRRRAAGRPRRSPGRGRARRARRRPARTSTTPPGGDHLRAFSMTFDTARATRSGSPRTIVGRSRANVTLSPARRSARSHVASTMRSRRTSSTASSGCTPRASSTMSAISAVSSSSSATMSARSCSWSSSGSRSACSSVWMFARRLEIGVRSSWLASSTRCRCASTELSSAASAPLKLRASRPSSSLALLQPMREVGIDDHASVLRVKRATGASAARATSAAEQGRERDAGGGQRRRGRAAAGRARSTSVSGRATCTAPSLPVADGQHAQVHAVDGDVGERPAGARAGQRERRGARPAARRSRRVGRLTVPSAR